MMKNILRGEAVRRLVRNDSYVTECVILRITRGQGVKEIDNEKRNILVIPGGKRFKKKDESDHKIYLGNQSCDASWTVKPCAYIITGYKSL